MHASLEPRLWPLLARFHDHRQTLADWEWVFGEPVAGLVPLSMVKGERAAFIRCPETGIPFEVHENWNGSFSALPPVDSELDSRIDGLAIEDLRMYKIDWTQLLQGIQRKLGLAGKLRILSLKPLLWHLCAGTSRPHYFAILGSVEEVGEIVPFLKSESGGCLLLPTAPDEVFAKLLKEGVAFHFLDTGETKVGKELPVQDQMSGTSVAATDIEMPKKPDLTNLELKIHLDQRLDTIGHEFVSLKQENTDLKKDLAQSLSNIAARVEPEFFQWIVTVMGAGSIRNAAKLLGIPNSSFSAKLKQYAARGGVYSTLFAMIQVRKGSGPKSVESFIEGFAGHQPEHFGDPNHISDLLNGLENLNAGNWPAVRDELIELVREELL